jgi:hypothetical protein
MSRESWQLTTPEGVIAELVAELARRPAQTRVSPLERRARKLFHAIRGLVRGA